MYARWSWILTLAVLVGCASVPEAPPPARSAPPQSVQPEPVQPEPVQAEPVQAEPVQAESEKPAVTNPIADAPMTDAPQPVASVPVAPVPVALQPDAVPAVAEPQVRQPAPVPAHSVAASHAAAVPAPTTKAPTEPPVTTATSVHGRIDLVGTRALKADAGDLAEVVVYYTPDNLAARPQPQRQTIYTRSRGFDPGLLVIPVGSTVAFPNGDPIRHNVYSLTPGAAFDLGLYGEGETRSHVFDRTGLVLVQCNVHHAMEALVLVLDTPHYTRVDADGRYRLANLPAGSGTLTVWHPRAAALSSALRLPLTAPQDRRLTLSKPRASR